MPRPCPTEPRHRAIALLRDGRQAKQVAHDLGIADHTIHNWLRQNDIDHESRPAKPHRLERIVGESDN